MKKWLKEWASAIVIAILLCLLLIIVSVELDRLAAAWEYFYKTNPPIEL